MKILSVELITNNLNAARTFYHETMGFPILKESSQSITFKIGISQLTFERSDDYLSPNYHYAFSIPENQFAEAKKYLSEKVELVKDNNGNDKFDFVNWNAHAMYFYDSLGNIGELIARHDLDNASDAPFSAHSITEISEIALPQKDVLEFVGQVKDNFNIPIYKNASAAFAPLGSEEGLFICVPLQRIWYPTQDLKSDIFPIKVTIKAPKEAILYHEKYIISSKKS